MRVTPVLNVNADFTAMARSQQPGALKRPAGRNPGKPSKTGEQVSGGEVRTAGSAEVHTNPMSNRPFDERCCRLGRTFIANRRLLQTCFM